jgi:4-hydroxybutyrate CoA-transferase
MKTKNRDFENWQETYREKLISLEQAAGLINSGDHIIIPNGYLGEIPYALAARAHELRNVTVDVCAPVGDPGWLQPGMEDSFNMVVRTYLHNARQGHDEGRIHFLPTTNGTWFKTYADNRATKQPVDVFLMEVSPPDENGFCTFGFVAWEKRRFAEEARLVIAEIDDQQIRSRGDTSIHVSEIDYLVDISAPPVTEAEAETIAARFEPERRQRAREAALAFHPRLLRRALPLLDLVELPMIEFQLNLDEPDATTRAIAENLKTVLRDRDTIQIGVGKPTKYMIELGAFDHLKDIAIFSEMACPGMGFLVKRGIATGRYASLHPGVAILTGLIGFRPEEITWAEDNPLIELHGAEYVVNIANIAQNKNMVAINNITQIDLTGQITCESQFGPRLINGPGGQIEFHIGAFSAPGGRAVSLMPSTWNNGLMSTIVPQLDEGSIVTIHRSFADYVITEWGVAELAGKTLHQRAEALTSIAHPNFREELSAAAGKIC